MLSNFPRATIALGKLLYTFSRASSRRLPPVWLGISLSSILVSRMSLAAFSFSARAKRHLRTSPGGRMPNLSLKTPELPPLSNTVGAAVRSSNSFSFSPERRLGRPVPPPKQTTFILFIFLKTCSF